MDYDDKPTRHQRRRPTRKWCKGKIGVEHTLTTCLNRYHVASGHQQRCGWVNYRLWRGRNRAKDWHYRCYHQRYCTTCNKILNYSLDSQDCPRFTYAPHPPATVQATN